MVHNEGSGRGEAGDGGVHYYFFFLYQSVEKFKPRVFCLPLSPVEAASNLEVSIKIEGKPTVGDSIRLCVMVKNTTTRPRALMEHVNAQVKEYNSNPKESFWKTYKELYLQPLECKMLWTLMCPFDLILLFKTAVMSLPAPLQRWQCVTPSLCLSTSRLWLLMAL